MLQILIPAAAVTLTAVAYLRRPKDYGVMTTERKAVYKNAISGGVQEPEKLDLLATEFEKQGLREEGKLLRKRAALRRLPDEIKAARKEVFRKALECKDKPTVLKIAQVYDEEGCTAAAARLREVASGLPDNIEPEVSEVQAS
jgi:hypothetical protein